MKDDAAFDAVVSRLAADKSLNKADLHEIASSVSGFKLSGGRAGKPYNKGSLVESIRTTQALQQRQDRRAELIGKMKPW